jgi:hypothetical protein
MKPNCFLIQDVKDGVEIYIGGISTEDAVAMFPLEVSTEVLHYAAEPPGGGWISEADLSHVKTVDDILKVLRERKEDNLIDFKATIGEVTLSTHDDGEPILRFPAREGALSYLRAIVDPSVAGVVIELVCMNPNRYVAIDDGRCTVYDTFDDYLSSA